jgi:ERCC4-type nuclease
LAKVLEIEKEKAVEIVTRASRLLQTGGEPVEAKSAETASPEDPALDPVDRMEGVGEKTSEVLAANGIKTVQDILKSSVETLSTLPGIGAKKAEKLIHSAQSHSAKGGGRESE